MDTCDYVFYNADAVKLQQQQQVDIAAGNGSSSKDAAPTAAADDVGSSDISRSSKGSDATPAAAAAGGPGFGYELQPVAVLLPPDGMKLTKGLPSRWLGSDHVCLVVDFELCLTNKDL
jgi:hypothetical protein